MFDTMHKLKYEPTFFREETSPLIFSHENLNVELNAPNENPNTPYPYCPIFLATNIAGGVTFTAYITDMIRDMEHYIGLLDILDNATEKDEVIILIDSPGGMVSTGASIASSIHSCKGQVVAIARGICASAASLIWSAAHKSLVSPLARFMYHMSSHSDFGNSEKIRQRAVSTVDYVHKCLLVEATTKGHITQNELNALTTKGDEVWISAKEMQTRIDGGSPSDSDTIKITEDNLPVVDRPIMEDGGNV